jgi:hypothetical protein
LLLVATGPQDEFFGGGKVGTTPVQPLLDVPAPVQPPGATGQTHLCFLGNYPFPPVSATRAIAIAIVIETTHPFTPGFVSTLAVLFYPTVF